MKIKKHLDKYSILSLVLLSSMFANAQESKINFNLFDGRYFTENESENGNLICLIGYNLAQTLFPNVGAVNKSIKISGTKFGVVGVFAKEGESLMVIPKWVGN